MSEITIILALVQVVNTCPKLLNNWVDIAFNVCYKQSHLMN